MQNRTLGIASMALGALAMSGVPVVQAAEEYPTRSIRFIIPFPPGGSNDIIGRLLGAHLTERLGRPVIIDNRSGAGGTLGTDIAAKSSPDGHTLLMASAAYAFAPAMYAKLPYEPTKAFIAVSKLGTGPTALCVYPGFPAKSVKELVAMAKAKPGQINFASAGVGSFQHLSVELFKLLSGIDIAHIPFKGGFPAMVDVMAGNTQILSGTIVQTMPQIRAGKLRGLATGGAKRSPVLPDLPTVAEAGVPGYEAANWWVIMVPSGTPAGVVQRLDKEIGSILALPEIEKRFTADGAQTDYLGANEAARFVTSEIERWSKVVKQAGIKPQ